ncbi:cofilin tropomyosin-type actin-binding protein [Grosmannia clavigera kw1407]|uniref:Cofilin tropomyosin-type actin-binding protein n=1 Tax=Grosmannia clavigera (strain kw1407 / UAMH 11150) TaxID=655863 RepID=F0XJG4_GROCL|nr:cofilin tropomyosin-type actin-binding protein [Grosmannia clavigera kw1407]EFX02209.1 cofilin tropomyosin-type actin-binding protein [Grosmannia clavigera kw1407]
MSLDVPAIAAAYDAVRSDTDPVNWLIIGDEISKTGSGKATGKMALQATGSGGLAELADRLDDAQAQYGYVRVQYANDSESTRVKFVLIVWIGEQTRVMRKARVSVETGAVRAVLRHHSIQVDARDRADLAEDDIVVRLRKAGGADYNGGRG